MSLFKTDKKRMTYRGTVIRMALIAVAAAAAYGIRVAVFPTDGWYGSLFWLILLLALYAEFVCIDELATTHGNRQKEALRTGTQTLKWPPVVCDVPFILTLLRATWEDGGITLLVRHGDRVYSMGIVSDFSKQRGFFDQAYFIEDKIFETEQEFLSHPLEDGGTLADISSLLLLSVDDGNDPRLILDRMGLKP